MNKQIEMLAQQFIDALHNVETSETDVENVENTDAIDNLLSLFSAEARLTNAALSQSGRELQGHEAIRGFWSDYRRAVVPGKSDFHAITTSQRSAGLFWTTAGTGPDGQDVKYDGSTLLEFDDNGRIVYFRGYYDTRELAAQEHAGT